MPGLTRESFWNRDVRTLFTNRPSVRKPALNDLSVFCRKLAFLLDAGVAVEKALSVAAGQTTARTLKNAALQAQIGVLQGKALSRAMTETGAFPVFMSGMCAIGEMTARLPSVMTQLAGFYERQARTEDELAAALLYPAAVTLMMLAVMVVAVTFVLPGYTRVFNASGIQLPVATRVLLGVSGFMTDHAVLMSGGTAALIVAAILFFQSSPGKTAAAHIRLYAPIFRSVYRQTVNLRFTQALSLLLLSGQSLTGAIPVCADVIGNTRVRRDLLTLSEGLAEGRSFWESLSKIPYMDPLLSGMAQVGEETGRLPQTLDKCRDYFEQMHAATIRRLNKLVEPVITIVLGLLLGLVMLAVILPTFALTNAM